MGRDITVVEGPPRFSTGPYRTELLRVDGELERLVAERLELAAGRLVVHVDEGFLERTADGVRDEALGAFPVDRWDLEGLTQGGVEDAADRLLDDLRLTWAGEAHWSPRAEVRRLAQQALADTLGADVYWWAFDPGGPQALCLVQGPEVRPEHSDRACAALLAIDTAPVLQSIVRRATEKADREAERHERGWRRQRRNSYRRRHPIGPSGYPISWEAGQHLDKVPGGTPGREWSYLDE